MSARACRAIRDTLGLILVAIAAPLGAAAQTDDTAYLQHILDTNGVIPPGRYYFRNIEIHHDNVVMRGSGRENTWLVQLPESNTNAITCHKARYVAVDNLSLDGNRSTQNAGSGIVFDSCPNFQVRNVNLVNIHGNGVTAQRGSSDGFFDNVEGLNIGYHLLSISESPQTRVGYLSGREIASAVINLAASPNSTLGQIVGQNTAPNDSGYGGMKVSNSSDGTLIGSIHMIGFPRGLFIKDTSNVVIGHLRVANIGYQCVLIQAEAEQGRADNNVILGGLAQDCGVLQKGLPGVHFSKQPNAYSAHGNRVRNLEIRDHQERLGALWLDEPQGNENAVIP